MADQDKLKQAHGNVVTGDRFWDREADIALLSKKIEEGANVALVAQRRMGKTSLMKEIAQRLDAEYTCVFVDFQGAKDSPDAIAEISTALSPYKSLWIKVKGIFASILGGVDKIGAYDLWIALRSGLTEGNWASKGDELFDMLKGEEKPIVLLLDEVPILVNRLLKGDTGTVTPSGRQRADDFMSWLRKNSIKHQGKVRIVISGSIGLEPVLRQANLSATINNFDPMDLSPWDVATAVECLQALGSEYGIQFDQGAEEAMAQKLGCCIPHHVQMFFDQVYIQCLRKKQMNFSSAEVAHVYDHGMLSARGHVELSHYEERLKTVLGIEKLPLAIDMLSEAAVVGRLSEDAMKELQDEYSFHSEVTADVQKHILWVLEHDGYLDREGDGYVFISHLLRDWWKKSHAMFFTPISKRRP